MTAAAAAALRTTFFCLSAEGIILQGIKRCRSNSTREDSQTVSVGIVGKCWCSELYKLMNCQCFIKTKVCHVLKVLKRVGGAGSGASG